MENVVIKNSLKQSYFVDHIFTIPPAPLFGMWTVVLQQDDDVNFNNTFEVREYVLPTFRIELNTTQFVLPSTKRLEGNCRATYMFGKPVDGAVSFKFGYRMDSANKVTFIGRTNYKKLINGEAQFSFQTSEFYNQVDKNLFTGQYRFVVEAEVSYCCFFISRPSANLDLFVLYFVLSIRLTTIRTDKNESNCLKSLASLKKHLQFRFKIQ